MPEVVLSDLYKKFGKLVAVNHIDLTVRDGQFLTLLGTKRLRQDDNVETDCGVY